MKNENILQILYGIEVGMHISCSSDYKYNLENRQNILQIKIIKYNTFT